MAEALYHKLCVTHHLSFFKKQTEFTFLRKDCYSASKSDPPVPKSVNGLGRLSASNIHAE